MAWSKTYNEIDSLNGGNEFTINDYPTEVAFNRALNNTSANHREIENIKDGTTTVPNSTNAEKVKTSSTTASHFFRVAFIDVSADGTSNEELYHNSTFKFYPDDNTLSTEGIISFYSWYKGEQVTTESILRRLDELGFKSGVVTPTYTQRQPTYNSLTKQGKMVILDFELSTNLSAGFQSSIIGNVPVEFRPTTEQYFGGTADYTYNYYPVVNYVNSYIRGTIKTNGDIVVDIQFDSEAYSKFKKIKFYNVGWKLN